MKTKTTINVLGKEFSIHFDPIAKQRYIAGIPSENIDDICDHFAEKLNVPSGKVVVPESQVAGNDVNTIICSTENARWMSDRGYGLRQEGVRAGFPFMLCYSTVGDDYAVLEMHSFGIGNEYTMTAGLPY